MPAEAIHLSALEDSLKKSPARSFLSRTALQRGVRLGAVLIDLPYFDRFGLAVARYLLKLPVGSGSPWGDAFHLRCPVAVGKGLLWGARSLLERQSTRAEGELLL